MTNKKILLVCSPYYKDITNNLIKGASDLLKSNSIDYNILNVPWALEIAPAIKLVLDKSLKKPIFDGYVALGCVIRGETTHYDYVCQESARALMKLSLEGLALGYGIITTENYNQALARSITGENIEGKGKVAAIACINQIKLRRKYTYES